jgi:DNA polymerase-1
MGRRIKDAFVAGPGRVLVEVDQSQSELRVAAFLSREPALLDGYRAGTGFDFHHTVAMKLLGDEGLAKTLRPYIKTFNFGLLFGAEVEMLVILLNDLAVATEVELGLAQRRWAPDEVRGLFDGFWRGFPTFAAWVQRTRSQAQKFGYVESHFGRRRSWSLITHETRRDVHKEAVNHPIQSASSDIVLLSLIRLHAWCQATGYARIVLTVHDSIVLEAIEAMAGVVADKAIGIMQQVPIDYGFDVPFIADAKIGPRWNSLVEYRPNTH